MGNFGKLTAYLEEISQGPVAGCACLVYQGEQELYRRYAGRKTTEGGEALENNTLYRLYSLTKLATAAAVLQLKEQKKLRLEDSVETFLPEWKGKGISIRHLLTMQSGLSYPYDTEKAAGVCKVINEFRNTHSRYTTREYAAMLAQTPLMFRPGTDFVYGTSYDVLAAVIEEVSGQTFGEYLQAHLFAPLHMDNTMFKICREKDWERLAGIYSRNEKTGEFYRRWEKDEAYRPDFPFEEGGGGLLSTIDDEMRLALMFQRNGRNAEGKAVLSEESVALISQNALDTEKKRMSFAERFFELSEESEQICDYGYGMGVRVCIRDGQFPDAPAGEFGWYGMSGSYVLIDRKNQITAVYMQQMIPGMEKQIHPVLRRKIYEGLYEN